jgi:molecular chaperone DnaK
MAKRQVSAKSQVPVSLYFEGKNLTINITRGDFERMTADLLQRTRDTTELVMQQAGVQIGQLNEVVLVGGSTHMPSVFNMLREVTGLEPSRELNPDTAVAQGAAIHAAILEAQATGGDSRMAKAVIKRLRAVTASDVNSHALGVAVSDPKDKSKKFNHVVIPKNTPIPHKETQLFVTNVDNQQRIHVRLLQGDARDLDACTLIGDLQIVSLPPNLKAGTKVEFTYEYQANGRIIASARELVGNTSARTEIVRDSGLSDAGLDAFEILAREYQVE